MNLEIALAVFGWRLRIRLFVHGGAHCTWRALRCRYRFRLAVQIVIRIVRWRSERLGVIVAAAAICAISVGPHYFTFVS
jgi:hypothetical protein